eukprot:CAMPEP_0196736468 /NCGR_PEP_ID=MMETSP1091-20130531/14530_1 /TAXON_ID=302021 /ORGANISM="Rhodomonas sp., Strain CCMP768" /LENGTH=60 /DNA_ID=CAMNT_0042080215 /DNA_START=773 /DNA_END=955 /DNA_ORIENTATION=+
MTGIETMNAAVAHFIIPILEAGKRTQQGSRNFRETVQSRLSRVLAQHRIEGFNKLFFAPG